jgi:Ca2+-binding EF-hand superfamily protein
MMGQGMMGHHVMMRMIFALMDSDGDGTISLQEFQAAHERIFKAMDSNKDGLLTLEEMQTFMQGAVHVKGQRRLDAHRPWAARSRRCGNSDSLDYWYVPESLESVS